MPDLKINKTGWNRADTEIWTARFHYSESVKYVMKPFTGCKTETSLVTNKASTSQRRKQRLWRIFTSCFYLFTLSTVEAVKIKVKRKFKH